MSSPWLTGRDKEEVRSSEDHQDHDDRDPQLLLSGRALERQECGSSVQRSRCGEQRSSAVLARASVSTRRRVNRLVGSTLIPPTAPSSRSVCWLLLSSLSQQLAGDVKHNSATVRLLPSPATLSANRSRAPTLQRSEAPRETDWGTVGAPGPLCTDCRVGPDAVHLGPRRGEIGSSIREIPSTTFFSRVSVSGTGSLGPLYGRQAAGSRRWRAEHIALIAAPTAASGRAASANLLGSVLEETSEPAGPADARRHWRPEPLLNLPDPAYRPAVRYWVNTTPYAPSRRE